MKKYEILVRFTWGEQAFSFRYDDEALAFQRAILLCEECILAHDIKIVKEN
jgi:hypothetical protein